MGTPAKGPMRGVIQLASLGCMAQFFGRLPSDRMRPGRPRVLLLAGMNAPLNQNPPHGGELVRVTGSLLLE